MEHPSYPGKGSALLVFIVIISSCCLLACSQGERKGKVITESADSTAITKTRNDSSQTPYICATRSLKAAENGDLKVLLTYVHPTKGLTITHVAESIKNHEGAFSTEALKQEINKPTLFTIVNDYEGSDVRKSTLSNLIKHYAGSNSFADDTTKARHFSASKDIRRNYTGNGTYMLVPPLAKNQTTISYHIADSTNEMDWQEIVLRTETYEGKDYLVEILRAYWTP